MSTKLPLIIVLIISSCLSHSVSEQFRFPIREATISKIKYAYKQKMLTTRELVEFYLPEIKEQNPYLNGVIEVNPNNVQIDADRADLERQSNSSASHLALHGIPVLLKGNMGTRGAMNTTGGSYALLGSVISRDARVATMSEWGYFRSSTAPHARSGRGGQGKNPYVHSADPCGSSSGSAISTPANLVTVSLGTETDGSILCPASFNSVVGIKPTVGIPSMDQIIPVSPRQDTVGPICRTVEDAVYVLDEIVDRYYVDPIFPFPSDSFKNHLKPDGLKGKRLGIVRHPFIDLVTAVNSIAVRTFEKHIKTLRQEGAIIIDGIEIENIDVIMKPLESGERVARLAEFKIAINAYLKDLVVSPVRSLADVIVFNINNPQLCRKDEYGQDIFLKSEQTTGIGPKEREALANLERLSKNGLEKLMKDNNLDAIVTAGSLISLVLAIGGFPGINVPAGYDEFGVPFGINFGGLKFSEPKLIEIAYAFEQATMIRKPPIAPLK
ncbi:hypothetical protein VNO78_22200 [Psophocarpus tetragonolobus]|uniref:Amidase domain-containing protein n=1 Tax=Psophocarpus tetragonolobus TaxID=3891 RepID=A0AAN9SCW3_PSOTE